MQRLLLHYEDRTLVSRLDIQKKSWKHKYILIWCSCKSSWHLLSPKMKYIQGFMPNSMLMRLCRIKISCLLLAGIKWKAVKMYIKGVTRACFSNGCVHFKCWFLHSKYAITEVFCKHSKALVIFLRLLTVGWPIITIFQKYTHKIYKSCIWFYMVQYLTRGKWSLPNIPAGFVHFASLQNQCKLWLDHGYAVGMELFSRLCIKYSAEDTLENVFHLKT